MTLILREKGSPPLSALKEKVVDCKILTFLPISILAGGCLHTNFLARKAAALMYLDLGGGWSFTTSNLQGEELHGVKGRGEVVS